MVGVPRSRGCVGCRQQKKKCIVISEPPCPRCKRLGISCLGYGERRLKFQDESQKFAPGQNRDRNSLSSTSPPSLQQSPLSAQNEGEINVQRAILIPAIPSNTLATLTASLAHSMDGHAADTGYNLAWTFGNYLHDVPRCLGFNESLDAAAAALVTGYYHFRRTGGAAPSPLCLKKYSQALKSIKHCLTTVETACEPTTLCAIVITIAVETLMSIPNGTLHHAGGAANILKWRGTRPPRDDMESKLLLSLRGPMAIHGFFLDESYYTDSEWNDLVSELSVAGDVDDVKNKIYLAKIAVTARLFQKTRKVLSQDSAPKQEIEQLVSRASTLHQDLTELLVNISGCLDEVRGAWATDLHWKTKLRHAVCARSYGIVLATQIEVNVILAALQGRQSGLAKGENIKMCQEICNLAEMDATHHRPLGSTWMQSVLIVGYIGASSAQDKGRVVDLINDYLQDFPTKAIQVRAADIEPLIAYLSCEDLTRR